MPARHQISGVDWIRAHFEWTEYNPNIIFCNETKVSEAISELFFWGNFSIWRWFISESAHFPLFFCVFWPQVRAHFRRIFIAFSDGIGQNWGQKAPTILHFQRSKILIHTVVFEWIQPRASNEQADLEFFLQFFSKSQGKTCIFHFFLQNRDDRRFFTSSAPKIAPDVRENKL